jgi:Tfp pilus assembly pilus retraction ATPase PilT
MSDESSPRKDMFNKILRTALLLGASRLELEPEKPALILHKGVLRRLEMAPLSPEKMELLLRSTMDDQQWKILEETGEIKFWHAPDIGGQSLRVHVSKDSVKLRLAAYPLG